MSRRSKFKGFLDLSGSSFCLLYHSLSVEGVKALTDVIISQRQNLRNLTLSYNSLGDAGAALLAGALRENKSLRSTTIANNQVGDVGAMALVKALSFSTTITSLDLRNNNIGDAGLIGLHDALEENHSLRTLELRGNYLLFCPLLLPRNNGSLVRVSTDLVDVEFNKDICERNALMHERTTQAVVTFIALTTTEKCSAFPKELINMLAQYLWLTRTDVSAWSAVAKRQRRINFSLYN